MRHLNRRSSSAPHLGFQNGRHFMGSPRANEKNGDTESSSNIENAAAKKRCVSPLLLTSCNSKQYPLNSCNASNSGRQRQDGVNGGSRRKEPSSKVSRTDAPSKIAIQASGRWREPVQISPDYRSSRLFVRNLPPFVTATDLTTKFSSLGGEITDLCVLQNERHKSRQCAFIGFKTQQQASAVKEYFDHTFLYTRRIVIQFALPRATPFERKAMTATRRVDCRQDDADVDEAAQPLEYACAASKKRMRVNCPSENVCDFAVEQPIAASKTGAKRVRKHLFFEDRESSEEDCAGATVGVTGDSSKNGGIQSFDGMNIDKEEAEPDDDLAWLQRQSLAVQEGRKASTEGPESELTEELRGSQSDCTSDNKFFNTSNRNDRHVALLGMHGRLLLQNLPYATTVEELRALCEQFGEVAETHIVLDEQTRKSKGYAFVTYVFPEHAVSAFCKLDGMIFQGRLLRTMPAEPDAKKEQRHLLREQEERDRQKSGSSYKTKKQQQLMKQQVENEDFMKEKVWNLLYVSANAAVDAAVEDLQVGKGYFLGREKSCEGTHTLAAKVALAESHILQQTREWIAKEGISVSAFERRGRNLLSACRTDSAAKANTNTDTNGKRSADTLIVKHLPAAHVVEKDLLRIFERIGPLVRFLVSPSKTVAIVQYEKESDAEKACKRLAYRKYENVPLFLEKAPEDVFVENETQRQAEKDAEAEARAAEKAFKLLASTGTSENGPASQERETDRVVIVGESASRKLVFDSSESKAAASKTNISTTSLPSAATAAVESEADEEDADGTSVPTLFVTNINFSTSETALHDVFTSCAGLRTVKLMTKKCPVHVEVGKTDQVDFKVLSVGYAFVEFDSHENALAACKRLQGIVVDGHTLKIQKCRPPRRRLQAVIKGTTHAPALNGKNLPGKKIGSRKLLVRNLAFQASAADLRGLFSAFGNVTRVRIPTQFEGRSRGFGFVEFATRQEAGAAMEALHGTHLYGRKLILEAAKQG